MSVDKTTTAGVAAVSARRVAHTKWSAGDSHTYVLIYPAVLFKYVGLRQGRAYLAVVPLLTVEPIATHCVFY